MTKSCSNERTPWGEQRDADIAEVDRFTRVVAYRQGHHTAAQLWQARPVATAALSGALHSLALTLQPYFFAALSESAFSEAEGVLLEMMERLAEADHEGPPDSELVALIIAERRALLYLKMERFSDAVVWNDRAAALCPAGQRPSFKVAGGRARAEWLAGGSSEQAAAEFSRIAVAAINWDDVHGRAAMNHAAGLADDPTASVPFDLE